MTATFTLIEMFTEPDGSVRVEWCTNDDNDDGIPDGQAVRLTQRHANLQKALEIHGKSRTGLWGQPVDVYVNGVRI